MGYGYLSIVVSVFHIELLDWQKIVKWEMEQPRKQATEDALQPKIGDRK